MVEFKESKFYKLLQDFFINNDKETFIQFLAEFYNKTEYILNKNELQDELIKELREMYIKFNDEGIDNKIVKEKVNYFIENSVKIQNIVTKLIVNTNNIENVTSHLYSKTNQLNERIEELAEKGTTVDVLEKVTKEEIERQIADGTITNLTIEDNSISKTKYQDDSIAKEKINNNFKAELEKKRSAIAKTINKKEVVTSNINLPYNTNGVQGLVFNCNKYEGGNITVKSRNLFNPKLFDGGICSLSSVNPKLVIIKDNVIGIQSTGVGSDADVLVTLKIKNFQLEPNTSYCFSATTSVKNNSFGTKSGVGKFTIIGDGVLLMSANDNNKKVFTTGSTGLVDITLNIQNAQTTVGFEQMITIRDLILAKSTELLNYTPYHADFIDIIPPFKRKYVYLNDFGEDIVNVDNKNGVKFDIIEYEGVESENKKTLVCFGDSITGIFYNDLARDYPYLISQKTNLKVYNVGFGGARMGQHPTPKYNAYCMYKLVDAIVNNDFSEQEADTSGHESYPTRLNTLKNIDFNKVDYVTIAYGTNDWGGGHTPNKPIDNDENKFDCTNYYGATRYVLKTLLQAYPHLKILLISPYFRYDYASDKDSDEFFPLYNNGVHLIQYVDALKEVGEEFKTPVLDMYRNMGANKYNIAQYFDGVDGVHFAQFGMNRIAEMIAGELKRLYNI